MTPHSAGPATRAEFITHLRRLAAAPATDLLPIDIFLVRIAAQLTDDADQPGWPGLAAHLDGALTTDATPPRPTAPDRTTPDPADPSSTTPDRTTADRTASQHAPAASDESLVVSAADLRHHLARLAADYLRDQREFYEPRRQRGQWAWDGGSWANTTVPAVLEAWASWLEDTTDHPRFDPRLIEPVTWASVAEQLAAARVYE